MQITIKLTFLYVLREHKLMKRTASLFPECYKLFQRLYRFSFTMGFVKEARLAVIRPHDEGGFNFRCFPWQQVLPLHLFGLFPAVCHNLGDCFFIGRKWLSFPCHDLIVHTAPASGSQMDPSFHDWPEATSLERGSRVKANISLL